MLDWKKTSECYPGDERAVLAYYERTGRIRQVYYSPSGRSWFNAVGAMIEQDVPDYWAEYKMPETMRDRAVEFTRGKLKFIPQQTDIVDLMAAFAEQELKR